MSPDQVHLLKALGSGVRPVDLGEAPADGSDRFGELLRSALRGEARTDLGVRFGPGVSGMFDAGQQGQIARAIDVAAAAGSEQALILHGRHTLRVDVRNRVVLDAPEIEPMRPLGGIDAFVSTDAPPPVELPEGEEGENEEELGVAPGVVITPARVVRNASLVEALAKPARTQEP